MSLEAYFMLYILVNLGLLLFVHNHSKRKTKSSILKKYAKLNKIPIVDMPLSRVNPSDLIGVPKKK